MATNCFLKTRESEDCGEFRGIAELVSLDQCRNGISQHLYRCHLSRERITEGELILVRSGFVLYDRSAEKRDVWLSEAPWVSRAVLGKLDKVKFMPVP